jgi:hypothetical protein
MSELTSQPASIQSLYSMYRNNKLFVNRRYQRKLVWTLNEKQKLIESVLKKYPIPAILLAERDAAPGTYEIIDGLQRLQALLSYIEMAFPIADGRYFLVSGFPTALQFSKENIFEIKPDVKQISPSDVGVILDYTITLSVMRGATETEINDVFGRINTYGHRLSDQERRQAGVQNSFSELVRKIASKLRGDVSLNILPLSSMPSISIDLPKTKHGYQILADEVFWVKQGVLRSTDLRDSMDEQCIADVCASIIGGTCLERSKEALDKVYDISNEESERILTALQVYGATQLENEFIYCINEIIEVCNADSVEDLRTVLFSEKNTNGFPAVFSILIIAFHEALIKENKMVSSYSSAKTSIRGLSRRIEVGQRAASANERRANINAVKGLIAGVLVPNDKNPRAYLGGAAPEIDVVIRRSEIETSCYELKQGILSLGEGRGKDQGICDKIINTIAAIANNGKDSSGCLIIGVADKESDANRIQLLDSISPIQIGNRRVVGIVREAKILGISVEKYVDQLKNVIKSSALSDSTKMSVLSSLAYDNYYGLGIVVINIPSQSEITFVGNQVYWRNVDSTELASDPKMITIIAKRF